MKISTRIKAGITAFRSGEYWKIMMDNNIKGKSGVTVNEDSAVTFSAFWQGMELITETLSTIPLQVFKRTDNGREVYYDHPLYSVLHDRANRNETAQSFRSEFQWNKELTGIGLAEKIKDGSGRIRELWNINPQDLKEIKLINNNIRFYFNNGKDYGADKIFYNYGPGKKGLSPRSRLDIAKEAIGLGLAAEQYGSLFFGQGTNIGGFLQRPDNRGVLKDDVYNRLKQSMNEKYQGLGNSHKLIILEDGMTFSRAGMPNDDAQFLETRKFQISDIARFLNLKSYMLGDLERATFSNIEQQGIENVRYSWRPRAISLEQAINQQLLSPSDQKAVYAEHNLDGLMQGDLTSQSIVWNNLVQAGILNADEVRAMINMNKQEGGQGKIYYMPLNMADKSMVKDPVETEPRLSDFSQILRINCDVNTFRAVSSLLIPEFRSKYQPFNEEEYTKQVDKLLEFQAKRAEKGLDTDLEITRMGNAFKYSAMQSAGVKKVIWKSRSDCPHCQHLHGKIVEIGQEFEKNIRHAPLKSGCRCDVEAYYGN